MSLPLVSEQLKKINKVFKEALHKLNPFVYSQKRNLLSDKTSHQAFHSSIILNEAQTPSHHPLGLACTISCLPASVRLLVQSIQWDVEEDGRGGGAR